VHAGLASDFGKCSKVNAVVGAKAITLGKVFFAAAQAAELMARSRRRLANAARASGYAREVQCDHKAEIRPLVPNVAVLCSENGRCGVDRLFRTHR